MQIDQIVIYSRDDRLRAVELNLGELNVVAGVKRRGKSALLEIIDWCFGTLAERLAVQRAERERLHSMTPQERLRTYRRGGLSGYQLSVWWSSTRSRSRASTMCPSGSRQPLPTSVSTPDYEERCRKLGVSRLTGRPM